MREFFLPHADEVAKNLYYDPIKKKVFFEVRYRHWKDKELIKLFNKANWMSEKFLLKPYTFQNMYETYSGDLRPMSVYIRIWEEDLLTFLPELKEKVEEVREKQAPIWNPSATETEFRRWGLL